MTDTVNSVQTTEANSAGEVVDGQPTPAPAAASPAESESSASAPLPATTSTGATTQPAPEWAELVSRMAGVEWSVGQALGELKAVRQQSAALGEAMDGLTKQVSFLPPQIRQMGTKMDGLGTAISEPKYRGLLTGMLGLYDLVDQVLRSPPATDGSDPQGDYRRTYEVLRTQIRQLLITNDIEEISANGTFDPAAHRAVRRVETADQAVSNQIVEVVRTGFRSQQGVLRYADVVVATFKPTESPSAPQAGTPAKN